MIIIINTFLLIPLLVPFRSSGVNDGAPPKKKKNKQNQTKGDNMNASKNKPVSKSTQPAVPPAQRKPVQNGISETQKKPEGKKQFENENMSSFRMLYYC